MKNIIIIPTYNEKDNVPVILKKIFDFVPDTKVLIVDDNSPDKTWEVAENLKARYPNLDVMIRKTEKGLSKAYIDGFKKVLLDHDVETVTMMDCDLSHNPKYLPDMLKLSKDYGLIIGSRYIKGGGVTDKWERWRKVLSRGANIYLSIIFRRFVRDWTGGFNVIKKETLQKIDLDKPSTDGYAFIPSLKYYLLKTKATLKEYPIIFEERESGESKMSSSIIKDGVISPWKIVFKDLFH